MWDGRSLWVGRRTAEIHRPDKVLFPADGSGVGKEYTNGDLVAYYRAVAPYSVLARAGVPVATPLTWEQLDDPADARRRTLTDAVEQARANPWTGSMSRGRALGSARRRLTAPRG